MCELSDGRTRVADEEGEDRGSNRDRDGAKLTAIFERVELVKKLAGSLLDLLDFGIKRSVMFGSMDDGSWTLSSTVANDGPHVPPCAPVRG